MTPQPHGCSCRSYSRPTTFTCEKKTQWITDRIEMLKKSSRTFNMPCAEDKTALPCIKKSASTKPFASGLVCNKWLQKNCKRSEDVFHKFPRCDANRVMHFIPIYFTTSLTSPHVIRHTSMTFHNIIQLVVLWLLIGTWSCLLIVGFLSIA